MKLRTLKTQMAFIFAIFITSCANTSPQAPQMELWYKTPARVWEETLPLGNGRIGIMPDGGINEENITLNDITMWSGSIDDSTKNEGALKYLPEIQKLLLNGKNIEAQALMYKYFSCGGKGSNLGNGADAPYGSFQIFGNMHIKYTYENADSISNYKRGLSLENAIAYTKFDIGKVKYQREYFVSHNDDVAVIKLSANKSGMLNFDINVDRPERFSTKVENGILCMSGTLSSGYENVEGVKYIAKIKIESEGGTQSATDNALQVRNANNAHIFISLGTNMLDKNYETTITDILNKTAAQTYSNLKKTHVEKYQKKFKRVEFELGNGSNNAPTNERLSAFQANNDSGFATTYFQYGRYLMICGTRENSLPLNLQGLWANTIRTPWNGDYHLNINLQMNYWPAEVANLSDLHLPMLKYTKGLIESGQRTAKDFYNADGWVAHVISNPWNFTAPGEHASWGATNTGGAWLCEHIWEHYAFTQDKNFLQEYYPVLKGACQFFLSSMIREKEHSWLVTAPSSSPENGFYMPNTKNVAYVCMGPTMDIEILSELFRNTAEAAKILNIDADFAEKLQSTIKEFPPLQISPNGYLQEWLQDYEETDIHHRHVSHLYGLYPANLISPSQTPALAEAAKQTLNRRGDEGTGWSRAWKINFWARLHDGNRAYKLLKSLLTPVTFNGVEYSKGGGTYANLFCAHPPFQIDGNYGGCAGIAEMLVQSQQGYIELLPAIPDEWKRMGHFKGLRVRGGAIIDAKWNNNKIEVELLATADNTFKIKIPEQATNVETQQNESTKLDKNFATFVLKKGDKARISWNY